MLVVFSPIFVADTKIIFRLDFVAPLNLWFVYRSVMEYQNKYFIVQKFYPLF